MKLLAGIGGLELEEHELHVWAKANTKLPFSLNDEYLRAIATEHTEGQPGDESAPRKIPSVDLPRAGRMFGELACHYDELLRSGILSVNHLMRNRGRVPDRGDEPLSVLEAQASMGIALELQEVIER